MGIKKAVANTINSREGELYISLEVTMGKEALNMGLLSKNIIMRQDANQLIYFDTIPDERFVLDDYEWNGPQYKTVSVSKEKGKKKDKGKEKRTGGLVGAAVGTVLLPGAGTVVGYAMTSKKKKKGKGKNRAVTVTDENLVEVPTIATIKLKNVSTGEPLSFGFNCTTQIDFELDSFAWPEEEEPAMIENEQRAVLEAPPETPDTITLLKQYKELLDAGILTQEEFEQKKKELL